MTLAVTVQAVEAQCGQHPAALEDLEEHSASDRTVVPIQFQTTRPLSLLPADLLPKHSHMPFLVTECPDVLW